MPVIVNSGVSVSSRAESDFTKGVENLRQELREAELRYTSTHPVTVDLKSKTGEARRNESVAQADYVRAARDELAMLRLKYTETHPEVVAAKKRVAESEEGDGGKN